MQRMLRNLVTSAACGILLTAASGVSALALQTPTTGQPGAPTNTCGATNPVTPGNAANSPGSPFNSSGQAGIVYAGNPSTASRGQLARLAVQLERPGGRRLRG